MYNVFQVRHYRYSDGEKVTSIDVTTDNENEVEKNFNGRMLDISKLGRVSSQDSSEDTVRRKFSIPNHVPFLP